MATRLEMKSEDSRAFRGLLMPWLFFPGRIASWRAPAGRKACGPESRRFWPAGLLAFWLSMHLSAVAANFQTIDFSALANPAPSNSPSPPPLTTWPRGAQTFGGVPFKVDGKLEVTGMDDARKGEFHPPRIAAIPIGHKAARLHLLHGADGVDKDGVPLARLILHYANGEQRAVRVVYGIHTRSWVAERKEPKSSLLDPDSRLAWSGLSEDTERGNFALRLFQTALNNPLPDQEIKSLEFISLFSRATPFIAGLALETGGAGQTTIPINKRRVVKKSLEFEDKVYHSELILHVADADTSAPLTNATAALSISDDQDSFYFGEGRTDGAGIIRLPFPPQQAAAYTVLVRAPGRLPQTKSGSKTNQNGFSTEIQVPLARGANIGGIVNDASGKPIAGAEIVIQQTSRTGPKEYTRIDYDTVQTDKEGRWSSGSVPPGFEGFRFEVNHPDFRPTTYTQVSTNSPGANTISRVDLLATKAVMVLPAALRVEGVVVDESGQPVKDVSLRLADTARADVARSLPCDAAGHFFFVVPQPGDVSLVVQAKGYRTKLQQIPVEPGLKSVKIELAKTQPFRGRVIDQNQQPVPGARVKLDSWNGLRLLQWQALTDDKGAFVWDSPPDGNALFYVSATNHTSTRMSFSISSAEQVFHLRKLSRVLGKVIDAETRKPIDEFLIVKGRSYNSDEPIRWERYDAVRGRKGEYSVRLTEYSSTGRSQVMVEAPGYMPVASPPYTKAGVYTNDFELKKGRGISGVVQQPDGTPVVNATVALVERSDFAYMERPGELRRSSSEGELQRTRTGGHFEFSPKLEPHTIIAVHASGYAEVRASNVMATGRVVLQPWGRVKGVVRVGKKIAPGQTVMLQSYSGRYGEDGRTGPPLSLMLKAEPDAGGNFTFDKVPPGERKAYVQFKINERDSGRSTANSHGTAVLVQPNETASVTIGGSGRTVTGRVTVAGGEPEDVDWRRDIHTMQTADELPATVTPPVMTAGMTQEERQKIYQEYNERQAAFWRSPEGRAQQRQQHNYVLLFETNGTFHVDNVEPGKYSIYVSLTNPNRPDNYYEHIGSMNQVITVPPAPAGKVDEPFDAGSMEVTVRGIQRAGRRAPKFELTTFEGKKVKLDDFAGKFVLLDFWATWAGTRNLDLQMLKAVYDAYSKDGRLVMLGVNLDNDRKIAETAIAQNGIKWPQTYAGAWGETRLPASFGIDGLPATILIDPEGKIAAPSLRGSAIRSTVRNRLTAAPRVNAAP